MIINALSLPRQVIGRISNFYVIVKMRKCRGRVERVERKDRNNVEDEDAQKSVESTVVSRNDSSISIAADKHFTYHLPR